MKKKPFYFLLYIMFMFLVINPFGYMSIYVKAEETEEVVDVNSMNILPTIATTTYDSFGNVQINSDGTLGLLRFDKGSVDWLDKDNKIARIQTIKDENGNPTFVYRMALKTSYNVYTALQRFDAVQSSMSTSTGIKIASIYTRTDWTKEWAGPNQYYMTIPWYRIHSSSTGLFGSGTDKESMISLANNWFASNRYYSDTLNFRVLLTPEIGFPTSIDKETYTLTSDYYAIRFVSAKTINDGRPENKLAGPIDNQGKAYITYNIQDSALKEGNVDSQASYDQNKAPSRWGDATLSSTEYNIHGFESRTTAVESSYLNAYADGPTPGAELELIDRNTLTKVIDTGAPRENSTDVLLPIRVDLNPGFSIYTTTWKINRYDACIDTKSPGQGPVGGETLTRNTYYTVNGWKANNVYIHQEIAFAIDIAVKYNLIPKNEPTGGDNLGTPDPYSDDEIFDALLQGTTDVKTKYDTKGFNLPDWLQWDKISQYLPYILIAIAVIVVFTILSKSTGGFGLGGGGSSTKVDVRVEAPKETYKAKSDVKPDKQLEDQFEKLNKRLEQLERENRRLKEANEDLQQFGGTL